MAIRKVRVLNTDATVIFGLKNDVYVSFKFEGVSYKVHLGEEEEGKSMMITWPLVHKKGIEQYGADEYPFAESDNNPKLQVHPKVEYVKQAIEL